MCASGPLLRTTIGDMVKNNVMRLRASVVYRRDVAMSLGDHVLQSEGR